MENITNSIKDITGLIGPLTSKEENPMYSFERPALNFWQGVYIGLIEDGFTHEQSMELLQSKHMRLMIDGDSGLIQILGKTMIRNFLRKYRRYFNI